MNDLQKLKESDAMTRMSKWLWLVLLAVAFGLIGAGCEPETVDDDSDLPWSEPEGWEGGPPIGM